MQRAYVKNQGFTVVELLIVIVVIGILAAISIVTYSGIHKKAGEAAVRSEISKVQREIAIHKAEQGTYPASIDEITGELGGTSFQYTPVSDDYCLTGLMESIDPYYATATSTPKKGVCDGHNASLRVDGGAISEITVGSDKYRVHIFTESGVFTTDSSVTAEYLVVAGGGGGGNSTNGIRAAGGGGAGGVLVGSWSVRRGQQYAVTIGSGGSGQSSGSNSSIDSAVVAIGGGAGGRGENGVWSGSDGGSGGGGGAERGVGGLGMADQGFAGGTAFMSGLRRGSGGGGGAGGVGGNAPSEQSGGNGGVGITSSISGSPQQYAGGGAGAGAGSASSYGTASFGGGTATSACTVNTGGGGGGGLTSRGGQSGCSGIVIIRYKI